MLEFRVSDDVVLARLAARDLAKAAGLGMMDQTRLATAVSELGRNALAYAVSGQCELQDLSDDRHVRLQVQVRDLGPGIADVARAVEDGYSTSGRPGAGLPSTKRLVDHFDIQSSPAGTCVTLQIVRARHV